MYQGIVFNVIYNLLFVMVSYVIHFALGKTMTPTEYGVIGVIMTILDFEYLFLSNGVRQSLSKEISSKKYDVKDIIIKSVIFQFILISVIFSINFFGAELFAEALNDRAIEKYIRYAAFLIPANGLYVIVLGINDGIKCFKSSAIIGVVYALCKLSVIPYIVFLFDDAVLGTEMGYLTGILAGFLLGITLSFGNRKHFPENTGKKINFGNYATSTLNFSLFFIIVSVVLSVDTLLIKAFLHNKEMSGYYTGAVNFAKVAYFVLSAFFTVILPIITEKYTKGKIEEASETIKSVVSVILAFVLPIVVIISATSGSLLGTFYKKEYVAADNTLMILIWAHFFMGITVMFNMIIAAANKKKFSSILAVAVIVCDITMGIILIKNFGMEGMAVSGAICALMAMIASVIYTSKFFKQMFSMQHLKLIIFSEVLWIVLKIIFMMYSVNNLILLVAIYAVLYIGFILLLNITKVINIKQMISVMFKK